MPPGLVVALVVVGFVVFILAARWIGGVIGTAADKGINKFADKITKNDD